MILSIGDGKRGDVTMSSVETRTRVLEESRSLFFRVMSDEKEGLLYHLRKQESRWFE